MRIAILGAGGVGGYFGGRLIEAGADVMFIVREARKRQLDRDGLVVVSPLGDIRVRVRAVETSDMSEPPADLVMLAPKAYDLASALDAIAPIIGPGTAVMPLLNGVAHLHGLARRFPQASPWGGVAHIGATLDDDGTIRHLNAFNRILFGPLGSAVDDATAGEDARARELQAIFARTPVEAETRASIEHDLWDKLVFLAVLAGATCLYRAPIGIIRQSPGGRATIDLMLDETVAIAAAEGFAPAANALASYRVELDREGSPSTSSMLRDIERGGPTERVHILGDLVERAERHGIAVPMLRLANGVVDAYERRRADVAG
ncbi:MAG: 2-dehydropantoate 2-reductase [Hyphomicrobiaceae bacterium]|nr:2-dehydropantoate 2-reductase [Hyphomicrobiaceae bacterium]